MSQNQELLEKVLTMPYEDPDAKQHEAIQKKINTAIETNKAIKLGRGLWICPGPVTLTPKDGKVQVHGRFLYPPETKWGHVEIDGMASGLVIMPNPFYSPSGIATLYLNANEIQGEVKLSVNSGGAGPGGIHLGFMRSNEDTGFFAGGALADGLVIATGTGTFKRVD